MIGLTLNPPPRPQGADEPGLSVEMARALGAEEAVVGFKPCVAQGDGVTLCAGVQPVTGGKGPPG